MRIVIAPDSFKESLSSSEVAAAIERGVRRVCPDAETDCVPMADGGEGTVAAIVAATDGRTLEAQVHDPLLGPITAALGLTGDGRTAVIEMAAASGLALLSPAERRPLETTTRGTGDLIRAALDGGAREFVIGIGGSATVDGGVGMARALGVAFKDGRGAETGPGGGALETIDRIDMSGLDPRIRECSIRVACDVTNPLLGPEGAARVFGPQKGATPSMVERLEAGLSHLADLIETQLGLDVRPVPGGGAAGGLGAGLCAFLGARLEPGVVIVRETVGLRCRMAGADLVFTGEGRLDGQSVYGKTPVGVAEVARELGIPVIALAGSLGPGWRAVLAHGITACFSIVKGPMPLEAAIGAASDLVTDSAEQTLRLWLAGGRVLPSSD